MATILQQQKPGSWTTFVVQKQQDQCETLTFAETDEHLLHTFELRQFWVKLPGGTAEYHEWQECAGEFVARISHVGGDGPERFSQIKYPKYTYKGLCKVFARNKREYFKWMLDLFPLRQQQVHVEAQRDFLETKLQKEEVSSGHTVDDYLN